MALPWRFAVCQVDVVDDRLATKDDAMRTDAAEASAGGHAVPLPYTLHERRTHIALETNLDFDRISEAKKCASFMIEDFLEK